MLDRRLEINEASSLVIGQRYVLHTAQCADERVQQIPNRAELSPNICECFWRISETLDGIAQDFAARICKTGDCNDASADAEWIGHVGLT